MTALAVSKRNWIHDQGKLPVGLANGRLLISTSITDGLDDGATGVDSQGFFDLEDLPPWDTWLCYLPGDPSTTEYRHGYLMSWVPPEFIDLAQMGMEVDYMDCLCWAEDVDTTFTRQLKAAGLFE